MNIFKRSYKVRRYGRTSWEDGVASAGYEDVQLMLDVQAKTRRNQDDPAGRTTTGTLTVYSDMELHPAESDDQTDGDRLFYIPNMPGSAAYTSNWAAEIFGPGNLKKSTSGYPQRLYNAALQGALGINQDGIFGANTEKAVKAFQAAHNLTADGIVGTRTKAALSKLL